MAAEPQQRNVQVHIVDDDAAVRDSLAFLFASSGLAAEAYASPLGLLAAAPNLTEGCIVTDVRMPEMDGLQLLARLAEAGCALPAIVITGHGDVPMAVAAMKAGAADFLEKPFNDEDLIKAVRAALARSQPKAPSLDAEPPVAPEIARRLALLSERERQVLDGLIAGRLNKTIAHDLGISPRTVEVYRAKLMAKMEAATFADLIRMMLTGHE
ncbi:MAG TPA: response regulator FixJ [Caulobacteraceae bacterium]|nr:response regulator FixJ [Caulobacteraceae bacterium]